MENIASEFLNSLVTVAASHRDGHNTDPDATVTGPGLGGLRKGPTATATDPQTLTGHSGHTGHTLTLEPQLHVEIVSAQGLLFEAIPNHESIHTLQFHVLYNGHVRRSPGIEVADLSRPVVCRFSCTFSRHGAADSSSRPNGNSLVILITDSSYDATGTRGTGSNVTLNGVSQTLVAQAVLDDRMASLYSGDFVSVEPIPCLTDYVYASGESPGALFLRLSLSSKAGMSGAAVSGAEGQHLQSAITSQQAALTRACRDVFQQVKAWGAMLKHEFPHLSQRVLKFVAEDECGLHRLVCSFVRPVSPGRSLDGPRFAARMVSLLPFRRESSLSGGRVGRWKAPAATLSCLQGDVEDHALLLCSLLLGWGLDAYVCLGSIHTGNATDSPDIRDAQPQMHCWVVTLSDGRITMWESLTGEQTVVHSHSQSHSQIQSQAQSRYDAHFKDAWALFRHNEYLVNVQPNCLVTHTSFDLRNRKHWRRFELDEQTVGLTVHPGAILSLDDPHAPSDNVSSVSQSQTQTLEARLESELMLWIRDTRRDQQGLQTHFDATLSAVLHPALASYELDRAAGATFGNDDFQAAVKHLVRKGEVFKAFPACFSQRESASVANIKAQLLRSKPARDVLFARSVPTAGNVLPRQSRLAVRVRVFEYPRGLSATWVMLAACYEGE